MSADRPVRVPVDGVLDLHTFKPKEVKDLVPEYLEECRRRGIYQVRIIHGKGTGMLRRIVQSALEKNPLVLSYRTADLGGGSWGATEVVLKPGDKN
jgi:DNA-nicking Smr family endonuclease